MQGVPRQYFCKALYRINKKVFVVKVPYKHCDLSGRFCECFQQVPTPKNWEKFLPIFGVGILESVAKTQIFQSRSNFFFIFFFSQVQVTNSGHKFRSQVQVTRLLVVGIIQSKQT